MENLTHEPDPVKQTKIEFQEALRKLILSQNPSNRDDLTKDARKKLEKMIMEMRKVDGEKISQMKGKFKISTPSKN